MKNLHNNLSKKFSWYEKWHKHSYHSHVHWGVLIITILFFGFSFFGSSIPNSSARGNVSPEVFATANGLHVLQPDEYALIAETIPGAPSGDTVEEKIILKSGDIIPIKVNGATAVRLIEYDPKTTTYLPKEAKGMQIHSIADFTGYDKSGKIDTAINRKFEKQSVVHAIVTMKSSDRKFYNPKDTKSVRLSKLQDFKNKRDSIAKLITGGASGNRPTVGEGQKDLKIINGFSTDISEQDLATLQKNPDVEKVTLDREVKAYLDESVPQINAPYAWDFTDQKGNPLTGVGIRIAVIDTGVDYTQPDLGGCLGPNCKVVGGWDFVNKDADPMDDMGHGTHVAATAAGKAGVLNGVAPDAKILAYKVLDASGSGYDSTIIAAIDRAMDPNQDGDTSDHADVITMSLGADCGTYSSGCGPDDAESQAVDAASAIGVVSTIAAGNSGPSLKTIGSPGTARTAITVAASCKNSQLTQGGYCGSGPIAQFSSRGPVIDSNGIDLQKPDIAAPGVYICAARWGTAFASAPTCFDEHHVRISGTSMATPHMAGVVALIKQAYPTYTPLQIKALLKGTARNLAGETYNDQGVGEVNVKAAIPTSPVVSKVSTTPNSWQITSDPTKKLSTSTQNFSVTSNDSTINSLTFSFTSPIPGITFSANKTLLNVTNKGTDTFAGTITVDNDIVSPSQYFAAVYLMQDGTKVGTISVPIKVVPTVTTPTSVIDYGSDNPDLSSWTSIPVTTTFTNLRTDAPQTLNVSQGSYPSGVTYQNSAPTITIPANGSASLTTGLIVNNSALSNGIYSGILSLTNNVNTFKFSTKFTKYYSIVFQAGNSSDIKGAELSLFSQNSSEKYYSIPITTNTFTAYVKSPGKYDAFISYSYLPYSGLPFTSRGYNMGAIVKEGITPNSPPITFQIADASRSIDIKPTDINGLAMSGSEMSSYSLNKLPGTGTDPNFGFSLFGSGLMHLIFHVNNLSSNYVISMLGEGLVNNNPLYYFGGTVPTSTGDYSFTNTSADLKKLTVIPSFNLPAGTSIASPQVWRCGKNDSSCSALMGNKNVTIPFVHNIYTTNPDIYFRYFTFDLTGDTCPIGCNYHFASPLVHWPAGTQKIQGGDPDLPVLVTDHMYPGLGPPAWMAKFKNTKFNILLAAPVNEIAYIFRQDYSFGENKDLPYQIYQNGSQVKSGLIPEMDKYTYSSFRGQLTYDSATAGQYQFKTSFPYQITGQDMKADVLASFDTNLSDNNPPFITRLNFLTDNVPSEVCNPAKNNTLQVQFDPNGGTISTVEASYSTDGTNYSPLENTNSNGFYTVSIPPVTTTDKITLRLKAIDSSGNFLQYTFEMPNNSNALPDLDTIAPTVSLLSPSDGSTISGITTLSTNATDNVGVTKVEFYLLVGMSTSIPGSTPHLLGTSTTAPYNFDWNTKNLIDNTFSVVIKAYDKAGNVGATTTTLVVKNSTSTDKTPPTFVSTTPSFDGAILSGVATLSATATDDVGVTKVEFYQGTTLLGTSSSAPYTFSWDTTKVANGTYSLTDKAYDKAGNVATSKAVNITVNNTITPPPDTTPPTVSLTAPVSGATLSGTTAVITANATDNVKVDHVDFYSGTNLIGSKAGASSPFSIVWDTTTTTNGTYSLSAKAYDAAGNIGTSTSVSVTVNNTVNPPPDKTSPTVSITTPTNGATVSGTTAFSATATDNVGVTKVEFYQGSTLIDTDTTGSPRYDIAWDTTKVANGAYSLTAKAYDAAGNVGTSSAVSVNVNNTVTPPSDTTPPTVNIFAPKNGATISGIVPLSVNVSDNVGVDKVSFYYGSTLIDTKVSPFNFSWDTTKVNNGTYSLIAKAYDAANNVGTSSAVSVNVNNPVNPQPDTTPPTVSITVPTSGVTVSGVTAISATATDNVGVNRVNFYIDNNLASTDFSTPYTFSWDTTKTINGVHSLSAKAYDVAGNVGTSTTVNVTVNNANTGDTTPPTVNITGLINGATVSGMIMIGAKSTDNVQTTKIEFYYGSTLINSVSYGASTTQVGVSWYTTTVPNGIYSLTAKAYDAAGNVGTSDKVNVIVGNIAGNSPTVILTTPSKGMTVKGTTNITASVFSGNVGVNKVEFYNGPVLLGTQTGTAPPNSSVFYGIHWDTTTVVNGAYSLIVKAYDEAGDTGISLPVSVTVNN